MSASSVFHALRGNSKAITLDNNHLKELPPAIVRLQSLNVLSAKNNQLSDNTSNVLEKLPQVCVYSYCKNDYNNNYCLIAFIN